MKRLTSERGSSTVELAVLMPIIFLIISGIIEFGRVLSVHHSLQTAAREGARIAALPGSDNTAVIDRINMELSNAGLPNGTVVLDPPDVSSALRNDPVTITVSLPYSSVGWMQGFFPGFGGAEFEASVVMRKEGFG